MNNASTKFNLKAPFTVSCLYLEGFLSSRHSVISSVTFGSEVIGYIHLSSNEKGERLASIVHIDGKDQDTCCLEHALCELFAKKLSVPVETLSTEMDESSNTQRISKVIEVRFH